MKLLIDAGNSRMKWALADSTRLLCTGACAHDSPGAWLEFLASTDPVDAVYLASVASDLLNRKLRDQLFLSWDVEVIELAAAKRFGALCNGYKVPEQLGVDRWAAMVGAWCQYTAPFCVIDCGSAVTVDAVDATGQHLGGSIIPGYSMQLQSLNQCTAGVKAEAETLFSDPWGRSTQECVQRGAGDAIGGLVERSVMRLQGQLKRGVQLIITGGDSRLCKSESGLQAVVNEQLVLQGMAYMVERWGE